MLITDWAAGPGVTGSLREEVAEGAGETRKYLLSHHEPDQYDRCYAVPFRGRRVRLCARCAGIYPGIVAGALAVAFGGLAGPLALLVVASFPAFALADWARTAFGRSDGSNPVRTVTGLLLGFAYGVGLLAVLTAFDAALVGVAFAYGALAAGLLALERHGLAA